MKLSPASADAEGATEIPASEETRTAAFLDPHVEAIPAQITRDASATDIL